MRAGTLTHLNILIKFDDIKNSVFILLSFYDTVFLRIFTFYRCIKILTKTYS